MRQKLITLDPTSWDLATKKDNFSEWVRQQLRLEDKGHTYASAVLELEVLEREILDMGKQNEFWYRRCRQFQLELEELKVE